MRAAPRLALLLASALVVPACIEADVRTELRADGSGNMGVSMKFTDKFVEIVSKMKKIDPKNDLVKSSEGGMLKKPDEKLLAELEKDGIKVTEIEAIADEKQISAKFKVDFQNVRALSAIRKLESKPDSEMPLGAFALTRDEKGIYTLAMVSSKDEKKPDGAMTEGDAPKEPKEAGKEEPAKEEEKKDPAAEAKKQSDAMALLGELMGEAGKLKFTVSMKVPGEVVDYEPKVAAKKEAGSVTWEFTFAAMMELQMSGAMEEDGENPMENFKVSFRMPEGKSLPESCLSPAAPKAAAKPAAPAPAPAPEKAADPK